ncbi:amidase family protein [Variovorax sp. PAMC28562]|uniref:amidase family protein n=1 Tax=Variovorax sp. PAMC28562 TaxID=2762323 RepID=UPI00164E04AE|nr:amidase family protein [Variovorax sp. PAMC28562]QNK74618.1 amidase family protein [Variovorax sp. PAMC28562]
MSNTDPTEIWRLSASRVATLVRQRKLSAFEAAQSALARLDAVNPKLNAVVDHRPDEVLAHARAIDAALARGEDPGPLAGVPVTVKINIDQQGFATSNGVNLQKEWIAASNSPVVDNLLKAGAVIVGRTNAPAFSYRWFTDNRLHGRTVNPRDSALTPGGSSGGAASSIAAGIGHIAHGTDIAGSIRYPAYACGIHGLRPSLGRVAAYNAVTPERIISGQITAVSGPLARTVDDLRLALAAMSAPDPRDPWWVPAPLVGPAAPRCVALCVAPDGMTTQPEVVAALRDAAERLRDAGWTVDEVDALPPIRDAVQVQIALWMGDGYAGMVAAAEREGDAGAIAALAGQATLARSMTLEKFSTALVRRAAITRQWQVFLERYPVVLLPACAELPFADDLDLQGPDAYARVWEAQMTMIGLPLTGLPSLVVSTGMVGRAPVGVQLVAGRYREDLCLAAGEAIEARGVPPMPIDPQ